MQRMALPVVLTAEGTTYDRTRAFIKVCSAQSLLAQASTRVSTRLLAKRCIERKILASSHTGPLVHPPWSEEASLYLPTLEPGDPLACVG